MQFQFSPRPIHTAVHFGLAAAMDLVCQAGRAKRQHASRQHPQTHLFRNRSSNPSKSLARFDR